MRYPILPIGALTAAALVLLPAFWHWRARNIPTLSLIVWLFAVNVIYGANSLAWSDNVWDKAPVWCDICAFLVLGVTPVPKLVVRPCSRQTYHWSCDCVTSMHSLYMQVPRHDWGQSKRFTGSQRPQEDRFVRPRFLLGNSHHLHGPP
jgi:hypothetical protein